MIQKLALEASSAEESHPYALQEPYVTASRHTAPTAQPKAGSQIPRIQAFWVPDGLYVPTNGPPFANDLAVFCISAWPNVPMHFESDVRWDKVLFYEICHSNSTNL